MRRATLISITVAGLFVLAAQPAFALGVDPDTGIDMVAGNVYALHADGGWMYVGGKFWAIRDPNNHLICNATNFVRFDEATGQGDCTFTPAMPGQVEGIDVMGGFAYVGGDFGLLRVDLSTGQVDSTFNPGVNNDVHTVLAAPDGSGVYIGGAFGQVGTMKRAHLAFVNTDGSVGAWNPGADDIVRRLRWSPNGYIVASGHFENVGGHFDQSIAEINPDGSVNTSFDPDIPEVGAMTCFDTAPTATVIYAACGQKHNFTAAFDATTGAEIWRDFIGGNGESAALATVDGSTQLFIGGHMGMRLSTSMPCPPTSTTTYLHAVVKIDPTTGTIDCSWDPHPVPDTHNLTGGWVEEVANGHLWLGGKFGKVDLVKHHGIARWTL